MSRIARFAVLVASLMSLFAMMSATAGAVTWDNSGDTAFTATNPSTGTLSVTGVNLVCHGASATGTATSGQVGNVYDVHGTVTFNPCFISGIPTDVHCTYTLTTSATSSPFTGSAAANCSVYQFGTEICKVEGNTAGAYHNPGTAAGKLTLNESNTLRTTNGSGGSCPLLANEPATLTAQTFTVTTGTGGPTPHTGPKLTRTA